MRQFFPVKINDARIRVLHVTHSFPISHNFHTGDPDISLLDVFRDTTMTVNAVIQSLVSARLA